MKRFLKLEMIIAYKVRNYFKNLSKRFLILKRSIKFSLHIMI